MIRVLVIHGPNLNLLGTREPHIYGTTTLGEIDAALVALGRARGIEVSSFQSNSEGDIVTRIQDARTAVAGLVINAGAYTHTSLAIRDALEAVQLPAVEVHVSNVHKREAFRHTSHLAAVCIGQVIGFGPASYTLGLEGLIGYLEKSWPRI